MKKLAILLFCCSIFSLELNAQTPKPLKITILNPTCKGSCNGRVRVELGGNTIVPLTITLTNNSDKKITIRNVFNSTEFKNLCAGNWEVAAYSETINSCNQLTDKITVPSIDINIKTIDIVSPNTFDSKGSISIEGYAQAENGQIIDQGYTYTYLWSNGATNSQIQNLNPGTYFVTMTNQELGCQKVGSFQLLNCEQDNNDFDVQIAGGIASKQPYAYPWGYPKGFIPMSVFIRKANNSNFMPLPNGYKVEWIYGNKIINAAAISIPIALAPLDVKVRITDACGNVKEATKRVISCDAGNEDLKNYFISKMNPPCTGQTDGSIEFNFAKTFVDGSTFLVLNDGSTTQEIFNTTQSKWIDYPSDQLGNYRFTIPSLRGGKTYTITGYMGLNCDVSFSFRLPEKETEKICSGYDKKRNLCLYTETCNGTVVGPEKNFKSQPFTIADPKYIRNTGEGGIARCRTDLYCLCDGTPNRVRKGKEAWETARVGFYWQVLEEYQSRTGDPYYDNSLSRNHSPCGYVRYCTLDPSVFDYYYNLDNEQIGKAQRTADGCYEFECGQVLNIFRSRFKVCLKDLPPFLPPAPTDVIGFRDCDYRIENLLQMVIWHKNGSLRSLWPGPQKELTYAGSRLENILSKYNDLTDKRLRCATITFCKNDLDAAIDYKIDNNLCDRPLAVPDITAQKYTCEVEAILLRGSPKGQWRGEDLTRDQREAFFKNNQQTIEKVVFICNNNSYSTQVNYAASPVFLLPDNPSSEIVQKGDEIKSSTTNLMDPSTTNNRIEIILRDSFANEKLLHFGELTFQNRRIPKGIMSSGNNHVFSNYVFSNQILTKESAHKLELQTSNWDTHVNVYIEELEHNKKYAFEYSDSILEYTGQILSDTYLQPKTVNTQDTSFSITGLFKGSLTLDSTAIVQTSEVSAFYLKVSAQGKIMGFQLVEKIDTTQGVQFSELVKGKVILSSGYDQGAVKINGQLTTLSGAKGVVVAKMGDQSTTLIQDISVNNPVLVKGLSYSIDTTQIGLVIQGIDTVRSVGNHLIGQSSLNQLSIASLSAQGILKWSTKVSTASLNLSKLAFTNGGLNGLFLGLTFQDSLKLYGHKLYSKGQTDIAILKFDPNGSIIQVDTFGTPEEETISQMMLSENLLFFGGEMNGPRKIRSIGLIDFINESAFDNRYPSGQGHLEKRQKLS